MIDARKPMHSLPQSFYSEWMHRVDLEYLWKNAWLYAGMAYSIPKPGDYFVYKVDNDETIIIRGDDGKIRAFANSCRHRGSRLCKTAEGNVKRNIVCPYHQWTYSKEGKLTFARDMPEDFKKEDNGLHKVHLREVDGLLFICLSTFGKPPMFDFEPAAKAIEKQILPHGFRDAKTAHRIVYNVAANWKLVYENNRECYHCNTGHPEYIKSNYDTAFSFVKDPKTGLSKRVTDPRFGRAEEIEKLIEEKTSQWTKWGFECSPDSAFPGEGWYRASRMPLRRGFLVESLDGQRVCKKLMGKLDNEDMGSMRVHCLPNFWTHCSSDHAVTARLTPMGPQSTQVVADWIVHKDAVEGEDYHLDKMLPFWNLTSVQDWTLCEENQIGLNNSNYQPGVLSDVKESGLEKYITWYLRAINHQAAKRLRQ
jgi:Rieske 2Fe-2S family protein